MYDPVAETEEIERKPNASRLESLVDKRVGLFDNGKPAAELLLDVVEERLCQEYPGVTIERYAVEHLNRIKNEDELASIERWADEEVDACIGAIGDFGSCTKYLVYGINAIEESGTPGVGLIDEGFKLDWASNANDFGRELRYYALPAFAEVTDKRRIRDHLTEDITAKIVAELTRSQTDREHTENTEKTGSDGVVTTRGDR